jgi:hypothetical protein
MAAPPKKNRPADERISPVFDAGLDGKVEVMGFVDEAADFAGRLGDVDQQRMVSWPRRSDVACGGHPSPSATRLW